MPYTYQDYIHRFDDDGGRRPRLTEAEFEAFDRKLKTLYEREEAGEELSAADIRLQDELFYLLDGSDEANIVEEGFRAVPEFNARRADAYRWTGPAELTPLITQLIGAGRWPGPDLLADILAFGAQAVPALAGLTTDPVLLDAEGDEGWAPLHAIALLGDLGPAAAEAVPAITAAMPSGDGAAERGFEALVRIGPAAVPAAIALLEDRTVDWYPRANAGEALKEIALQHQQVYDQVTAALRGILASDDEADFKLYDSVAIKLARLADPEAYTLIMRRFEEGAIWPAAIDREGVEELYARGGEKPSAHPSNPWLKEYRQRYRRQFPDQPPAGSRSRGTGRLSSFLDRFRSKGNPPKRRRRRRKRR